MVDDQQKGWISNADERKRAKELQEKSKRGELTQKEKGELGAYESRKSTEHDPASEHKTKSWMAGDDTRKPSLSDDTKDEVERIKAKEARGETLTRRESGVLGGASRAKEND